MVVTVTASSSRKSLKPFDSDRNSKWSTTSVASNANRNVIGNNIDRNVVYRREIQFILRDESEQPVFPFCQAAADARCRYRWPPWPHRLDRGRPSPNTVQVPFFSLLKCSSINTIDIFFFFWFVYLPWKLIVINQVCSWEVAAVCVCLQKNESYSRISYRTRDKWCDKWEKWMQIKDIDSIQLLRLWYRLQASHYQIRHSYLSHSRISFLYIF